MNDDQNMRRGWTMAGFICIGIWILISYLLGCSGSHQTVSRGTIPVRTVPIAPKEAARIIPPLIDDTFFYRIRNGVLRARQYPRNIDDVLKNNWFEPGSEIDYVSPDTTQPLQCDTTLWFCDDGEKNCDTVITCYYPYKTDSIYKFPDSSQFQYIKRLR